MAAVVFSLEAVTAGVVGVCLIGEKLSGLQLAGAALIMDSTTASYLGFFRFFLAQ